jgi:hypothetical protein
MLNQLTDLSAAKAATTSISAAIAGQLLIKQIN